MRLGFDARTMQGSGVGTYSRNLLLHLSKHDIDLVVFCPDENKGLIPPGDRITLMSVNADPTGRAGRSTYASLAKKAGVDVFHFPTHSAPAPLGVPLVVTVHDVIPLIYPRSIRNPVARMQYRGRLDRALEEAHRVITVSRISRSTLTAYAHVDPSKLVVIENGVSDQFRPVEDEDTLQAVRRRYGLPDRFALWIGEFRPQKNLEFLVSAWARARSRIRSIPELVLAGAQDGDFRKIRREVARRGLEDSVHFPGFIRQDDLPALYSAAEVFVFPSLYEGFGLPPLEAMACGTPTIVSNSSSLPEATGRAAVMFNPTSPDQFVAALERLLSSPEERERLRQEGFRRAAQFSWERATEQTLSVYRQVVSESGTA